MLKPWEIVKFLQISINTKNQHLTKCLLLTRKSCQNLEIKEKSIIKKNVVKHRKLPKHKKFTSRHQTG